MNMDRISKYLRSNPGRDGKSICTQQLDTIHRRQEWSYEQIHAALLGVLEGEHKNQSGATAITRWEMKGHGNSKRYAGMWKEGGDTKTEKNHSNWHHRTGEREGAKVIFKCGCGQGEWKDHVRGFIWEGDEWSHQWPRTGDAAGGDTYRTQAFLSLQSETSPF